MTPHCLRQFAKVFVLDADFAAAGGKVRIQHMEWVKISWRTIDTGASGGKVRYLSLRQGFQHMEWVSCLRGRGDLNSYEMTSRRGW